MDAELKSNIKLVLFIFSFIVCLWLLKMLFPVITLVIIALLIVYLITPLVEILKKMHIPQLAAATIVFSLFMLTIILISYFLPPMIFREIRQLAIYIATDFRQYITMIFQQLNQIDLQFDLTLSQTLTSTFISIIERIPSQLLQGMNRISTLKIPFLSEIWSLLGLFFLIFFLLLDFEGIKTSIVSFFPPKYQKEAVHVISVIDGKAGAYMRGNLIRCSVVGLITYLGLSLMGMPFALILGITAGLLNIIYNIGPFMAAIPAVLISFTPGTPSPLLVISLYIIIQTLDPFVFTPLLLGKAVDLRPITVVIAILCGARLMGLLGIIIAIPLTAIVKVLLNHYYLQKMNNGHCVETKITTHSKPGKHGG